MSKIEKTLELNITHELLLIADSIWWYIQPLSLKKYWRPHLRFPLIDHPKSYATGLHINAEGKKGGGYDVCIKSPSNNLIDNPRLLFMQFKAGQEKLFNSNPKSEFYGDIKNPNIHVEFDINSNKNNDQHELLQLLAKNAGNKDAVVYVFPRIVDEAQLIKYNGRLLRKTSFISISEMDIKANKNRVTINDKKPHKFRTCYNDYTKNEVNWWWWWFGAENEPGDFLGEIFAIRLYRALSALQKTITNDYKISSIYILDALIRHTLNIGQHLGISKINIRKIISDLEISNKRFESVFIEDEINENQNYLENNNEILNLTFKNILKTLKPYFDYFDNIKILNSESDIPKPPINYSIEINQNLVFNIPEQYFEEEINNLTYMLI